jgi:hypothetical protein
MATENLDMATALANAPEQGQLLSVRSRNWIVNEVVPSTLPTSGLQEIFAPHTVISSASVDDDGLGEQIQVSSELKPGANVVEKIVVKNLAGSETVARLGASVKAILSDAGIIRSERLDRP